MLVPQNFAVLQAASGLSSLNSILSGFGVCVHHSSRAHTRL
jgi:hypothetical protein